MPSDVTNKIIFDKENAFVVFNTVCPCGKFDFELLIPSPPGMYRGNLSREESQDFKSNWYDWCIENWGTKWNAYSQEVCPDNGDGRAFIKFDTAWNVPYPIIAAFANKFNIPFELRYNCEGAEWWGIEIYGKDEFFADYCISRLSKDINNPEHRVCLCVELKGYNPDELDEEDCDTEEL